MGVLVKCTAVPEACTAKTGHFRGIRKDELTGLGVLTMCTAVQGVSTAKPASMVRFRGRAGLSMGVQKAVHGRADRVHGRAQRVHGQISEKSPVSGVQSLSMGVQELCTAVLSVCTAHPVANALFSNCTLPE